MSSFKQLITALFSTFRPGAQFASIRGYVSSSTGEVANHSLLWRVNYEECVRRSLQQVREADLDSIVCKGFTRADLEKAQEAMIASFEETLEKGAGNNSAYVHKDTYSAVLDAEGNPIRGLKLHKDEDVVHIAGVYRMGKEVLVPGTYKTVKSRPLTLAKNELRRLTDLRRWGQYKLTPGSFDGLSFSNVKA